MKKIVALGGSNSKKSINRAFAAYVANQVVNAHVEVIDLNDFDLPLYGIDTETKNGIPTDAKRMNDLLSYADGFVISLAEHNGAYSTAFKNAFDWLSRIDKEVWKNKPMLLMATSPGGRGGVTVLDIARAAFPHLGGNIVATFSLPKFYDNFSDQGISDQELSKALMDQVRLLEEAL